MTGFFRKYLARYDDHMQELLAGTSIAFALKVFAAGLAFGLNVVLARLLGAEGSGIFFLAFTIVLIVATVGRVGMENALVKFIAANIAAKQPGKILGVYQRAIHYSLFMSIPLSVFLYLLAPWASQVIFTKPELVYPLRIMAMAVVPLAILTLHAHALQGLRKIAASISVLSLIIPLLTIAVAILFVPRYGIDAALWGYLLANIITLLVGRWFWLRATGKIINHKSDFGRRELLTVSMPLFGVVMLNMIIMWSPLLLLGIWESSENIGIYSAASRTAMLTSFILVAVNSIAAPKFAMIYQQGDIETLGVVARNSAKIMLLLATPVLLLFMLLPELVLTIFGEQFKQGAVVLVILAIGQFINVATGSVGYLLMMSGNERLLRNNLLFSALLGMLLNLWLIPNYGIIGAAVGAALVLSLQNLVSMMIVWKKLKIMTFPWVRL